MTVARLERRAVVAELLHERGSLLLVTGLGGTTWDAAALGDDAHNFYLWGGMGLAVSTGLGLALAQPGRRVLVVTGDGEMLMGLGSLATVAAQQPPNLAIAVIDNERYGETGDQLTHTAGHTDLVAVARGAGIAAAVLVDAMPGVSEFRRRMHGAAAPLLGVFKVGAANPGMVLPPRDGPALKERMRRAIGVAGC